MAGCRASDARLAGMFASMSVRAFESEWGLWLRPPFLAQPACGIPRLAIGPLLAPFRGFA